MKQIDQKNKYDSVDTTNNMRYFNPRLYTPNLKNECISQKYNKTRIELWNHGVKKDVTSSQ